MRTRVRKVNLLSTAFFVVSICIGALVCTTLASHASGGTSGITIVNSSTREIRHVYLSAPDQNDWGPDQLVQSVISPNGGSFTINDVSCSGSTIKVVAEDQDGCFSYQVVSCSGATWTITNDTARDCGN
jgi:hypothetical protein